MEVGPGSRFTLQGRSYAIILPLREPADCAIPYKSNPPARGRVGHGSAALYQHAHEEPASTTGSGNTLRRADRTSRIGILLYLRRCM